MSRFAVTVERIADVWPHANADRLELARVASMTYQFVIARGNFQPGDLVVYFPIDSLLPESIIERLGLAGKLAGAAKNRVKTVKLRGEISQGVVAEPALLLAGESAISWKEGDDVTALLGVVKYEPPPVPSHAGKLLPLPPLVSVYDIEGAERFVAIVELLMDQPVLITEKLEGSHFAASINREGEITISQRRYRIEPVPEAEHDWHKAALTSGIRDVLPALYDAIAEQRGTAPELVTVRGELVGTSIQGNYYRLPEQRVYIFEIEVNGQAIAAREFLSFADRFDIATVPILAADISLREWLNGQPLAEKSNGTSLINPALAREGVVIRPMQEQQEALFGRVILKQRSPAYLAGSDY